MKKNLSEMKNTITDMKNTLQVINSGVHESEYQIINLEDKEAKNTLLEQQKEKNNPKK